MTMSEIQELEGVIHNRRTSVDDLRALLARTDEQLDRYATAMQAIEEAASEGWTYERYQAVFQAASGGTSSSITRDEYATLVLSSREHDLVGNLESTVAEGRRQFQHLKTAIEGELEQRSHKRHWFRRHAA